MEGNQPKIIENDQGRRTTPSIVAFTEQEVLVGLPAKQQAIINPENTFYSTKRLIGRKFNDVEVQRDFNNVPYKIVPNNNGDVMLSTTNGKSYSPSEIGGIILNKMKDIASNHLNVPVNHAIVTVPAYFNDSQRLATKNSGKLIGLNILRVINEPTAAALAYGCNREEEGIIAVFDFGGGTFDISILDIENGVFEVRATNGNTHLGGEDCDIILLNYIIDKFQSETGIDLKSDRLAIQRIKEAAEQAKIELSTVTTTEINLPFIHQQHHIKLTLTEDELDEMTLPLIEKTIEPVKKCIRDSNLKISDIDQILLVGGMTRMPRIRKLVQQLFNKKPTTSINPDEAVALGAAIQGGVLSGQIKNVVLLDVTPLSLGIETYGGIFSPLIPRNSKVPIRAQQMFSTAIDGQTGVEIKIYQGERSLVKDNKLIGNFKLTNIPPGPKGTPQIAVSFEIDADGIINVTASDKTKYPDNAQPNTVSIQVTEISMTDEEVEKMIEESNQNKQLDQELRNLYQHASRAEILVNDTELTLNKYGNLMTGEQVENIRKYLDQVKSIIEDIRSKTIQDPNLLNEKVNAMQNECMNAIKYVVEKQAETPNN
ncbi:Heat shock protein SSC1 mitochondrial [Spathaspora sp. JA1]|nr:Heat shock protein SSC1 mitochondrial [Spathaspora sp. JA1]